jgi:adenine-specific DNA-methyltransferase
MATKKTPKKAAKVKKVDGLSVDVQQEKIAALKQVAPEVFADGRVDVEKLKKLIGESTIAGDERYRLEWAGKSEVFDEIAERSSCTLTLDPKRSSKDWEQSNNVFIEGENLEVLRTLQKAYHGKVKMIYIDPPYNTGKDFVYNDNFRETEDEYCED